MDVIAKQGRPHTADENVEADTDGDWGSFVSRLAGYEVIRYRCLQIMTNFYSLRKHAARVGMPVRSVTVAEPPRISMLETITLVARPKNMKVRCPASPHLCPRTSRKVCAFGACCLSLAAFCANSLIKGSVSPLLHI